LLYVAKVVDDQTFESAKPFDIAAQLEIALRYQDLEPAVPKW
jgi:hypothetical protein